MIQAEKIIYCNFPFCTVINLNCCSVTKLCPTLCNPIDCSIPGFPVLLQELTQTHVHWAGDAIQPSHPLSSPSPPAFSLPSIRVFSTESVLHIRWPEYWSFTFSIQSFQHLSIVSLTFTTPLLGRQNLHSYYIKEEIEKQTSSSIKSSN